MRTRVCYLKIQLSHGKQGNARFANEGHLRFVSVAFGFNCGRWKTTYASEHFRKFVMNFLNAVVSILLLVDVVLNNMALSKFPSKIFMRFYIWFATFWQSATACTNSGSHHVPCIDILFIYSFHESIKRLGLLLRYWTPACLMSKWWLETPYNWWELLGKNSRLHHQHQQVSTLADVIASLAT